METKFQSKGSKSEAVGKVVMTTNAAEMGSMSTNGVKGSIPEKKTSGNNKADESINEIMASNRVITDDEVKGAPVLLLEEENGELLKNNKIKITAAGMINGRKQKDGVTIFGKAMKNNMTGEAAKLDFELNFNSEYFNNPYVFVIYYQRESNAFFIRSYCDKTTENRILFIKIASNCQIPLKKKEIISIGECLFQVSPLSDGNIEIFNLKKGEDSAITLKACYDPSKQMISLGRDSNCDIPLPKEKSLSRVHTSIIYDNKNSQWVIRDGIKEKSSLNGTWILATHKYPIYDGMIIEILGSKIKISYQ